MKSSINEILPRIPFLVRIAIAHSLGHLETSSKWSLKTTLIVNFVRSLLTRGPPKSISVQQAFSLKDPGIEGPMWVSKIIVPAPSERDALDKLLGAIDARKSPGAVYNIPTIDPIEAEWTGFRKGANSKAKPPTDLAESALYERMMEDTSSDVTILYIHGGALYLMDPATHRPVCSMLGKLTGGRCLSVRYRLAPRYPFPAALLDCLLAYLCLLSPPPGSYHQAVPASRIVFAGDSAGGTLSFSLLQLILQIQRTGASGNIPTIRFHGKDVPLHLPAGVATSSPWTDLTMSMPSVTENAKWDYLPPPKKESMRSQFPACELWPTEPTREDLYCEISMLIHPIASPIAAQSSDWKGACPVFILCGQELLTDESRILSRRLAREGVPVELEEYESMPHCWPMVLRGTEVSRKSFAAWADFISRAAKGEKVETRGRVTEALTLREIEVDVRELSVLTDAQAEGRIRADMKRKEALGLDGKGGQIQAKL